MKVITAYPIVKDGKLVANKIAADTLNFHSANGQEFQNVLSKAKEAGLGEAALKTIAALRKTKPTGAAKPAPVVIQQAPAPKGMSNTTKILLAVGGVVVLGAAIYLIKKSK